MHRIQVQLSPQQERQLRELATLRNVSISALIREGVEQLLGPEMVEYDARTSEALAAIGHAYDEGPIPPAETAHEMWGDVLYDEIQENRP